MRGDRDSIEEVMRLLLPQIQRWAVRTYFFLPDDDVKSVVNRVLAETCARPFLYDPSKCRFLISYLCRLISKRMIDLYKSTNRRAKHEELFSDPPPETKYCLPDIAEIETRKVRNQFFKAVKKKLDKVEREAIDLLRRSDDDEQFVVLLRCNQCLTESKFCAKNFKGRLIRKVRKIAVKLKYTKHDLLDTPTHPFRNSY